MSFVVCASCARHVRASEATCPFCKKKVVAAVLPPTPMDKRKWHALVMAIGAAASTEACGKTNAQPDAATIAAPYGVAMPDLVPDAAPPVDAGPVPTFTAPRPPYGVPRNDVLPDGGKKKKIGPLDDP
jgi:hypothetical protein